MEFNQSVITNKGRTLMAKLLSGRTTAKFTKIVTSSTVYTESQLESLTVLSGERQTSTVQAKPNNGATVSVEAAFDNKGLISGYDVSTVGLYATDPDEGEILYAVSTAKTKGYMPADTGVSSTGLVIRFYTEVGNASQVNMTVDSASYATKGDIKELQNDIEDLQGYVGYNDSDIYGVEVDMTNRTFKRLAGSVNRTPGASFDTIKAFGGRKRCILTDSGVVLAYYGETGYTETGALLTAVTKGTVTYPIGTKVQVMVEQPLFYYRVSPIVLDPIADGKGHHLRKGRYYISDRPKIGFKVHPAFVVNGSIKDKIYLSAYDGSIYDTSSNAYVLNDEQVADFNTDLLSSIAGTKPASGLTQNLTRENLRKLSQKRGAGWQQAYAATIAATQLLFLIEYNTFNWQTALGQGATKKTDDGTTNMAEPTGGSSTLGNKSGQVANQNGVDIVSYRGEENFFGNIWKVVDGMNLMANGIHALYIADHDFTENTAVGAYKDCGFTVAKKDGFVSAFGYSPEFDWLFMTSETNGNTSVPVGDYFWQNNTATDSVSWRLVRIGGRWNDGSSAGSFGWIVTTWSGTWDRSVGGRLVYVA